VQPLKASLPIFLIPAGNSIVFKAAQSRNALSSIWATGPLMTTDFRLLQASKANLRISVTPDGIVIFSIPEWSKLQMLVNDSGKVIVLRLVHLLKLN
jgi:hypothetical protein